MARAKRHIHKYHKVFAAGTKVWACALPDCPHYMPQHLEDMVKGKNTYCWSCGEVMILDPANMKEDRPKCYDCSNQNSLAEFTQSTVDNLLKGD